MISSSDVFQAALSLTEQERAALARQLILSLDNEIDAGDISEAWTEEIQKRRQAVRDGEPVQEWREAIAEVRKSISPEGRG